jgi:hypothetical protein
MHIDILLDRAMSSFGARVAWFQLTVLWDAKFTSVVKSWKLSALLEALDVVMPFAANG